MVVSHRPEKSADVDGKFIVAAGMIAILVTWAVFIRRGLKKKPPVA